MKFILTRFFTDYLILGFGFWSIKFANKTLHLFTITINTFYLSLTISTEMSLSREMMRAAFGGIVICVAGYGIMKGE